MARARGATSVVLVGVSFGGTLALARAAQVQLTALTIAQLFMASQDDTQRVGAVQQRRHQAPEPSTCISSRGRTTAMRS
jgi:hypothetical protein